MLENIALGVDGVTDMQALAARIVEVSHAYGLPLDPDREVHTLSVGERQRIEIVRCLLQNPKLLIMDEPTSVLTPQEVEQAVRDPAPARGRGLLDPLHQPQAGRDQSAVRPRHDPARRQGGRSLRPQGRDGAEHGRADDRRGAAHAGAAPGRCGGRAAAGRPWPRPAQRGAHSAPTSSASRSRCAPARSSASPASPATARTSCCWRSRASGRRPPTAIRIDGKAVGRLGADAAAQARPLLRARGAQRPRRRARDDAGRERRAQRPPAPGPAAPAGFIKAGKARELRAKVIKEFDVRTPGVDALARSLSGGNLQKFIVGREMLQNPGVLVVSQPTWGVDAGAAAAIHQALIDLAANGRGRAGDLAGPGRALDAHRPARRDQRRRRCPTRSSPPAPRSRRSAC